MSLFAQRGEGRVQAVGLKGNRFVALSGEERIVHHLDPDTVAEEDRRHQRKAGRDDDAA